jgi:hypothetical protein
MPALDATYQINLLQLLSQQPPAEVQTSTSISEIPQLLLFASEKPHQRLVSIAEPAKDTKPQLKMVPWLADTMEIIEAQRQFRKGVAGSDVGRVSRVFVTAEMLASLLASVPSNRRPQMNVDEEGIPSFATVTQDFYLHLTVDAPERLTWYAVAKENEYFQENVAFEGQALPQDLKQLFYL